MRSLIKAQIFLVAFFFLTPMKAHAHGGTTNYIPMAIFFVLATLIVMTIVGILGFTARKIYGHNKQKSVKEKET